MRKIVFFVVVFFLVSFLKSFAGEAIVDDILNSLSNPDNSCQVQKGYGSWYGLKGVLLQTANGGIYSSNEIFAASKTLPLGSTVLVRNLYNRKEIFVRIVDRGPYIKGRILDLSRGAAKELDMLEAGVVPIKVYTLGCEYALNKLRNINFYPDSAVASTSNTDSTEN